MVRYLGAITRRENAINRAVMAECPGVYGMVPFVQAVDAEFEFLKRHVRKDHQTWKYFQNYFTKLTGIPSTSMKEIL